MVSVYSKYTRALIFDNMCQGLNGMAFADRLLKIGEHEDLAPQEFSDVCRGFVEFGMHLCVRLIMQVGRKEGMHMYARAHTCIYVYAYIQTYICIRIYTDIRNAIQYDTHTHIHIHTCTRAHLQTHTHTHTICILI